MRVFNRLQTLEIRGSPDFECSVPRRRVEKRPVLGKCEGGDGVNVMHPRALLVAANLDVVLGGEEFGEPVVERGKRGDAFVVVGVVIIITGLVGCFPDADFVVLVSRE